MGSIVVGLGEWEVGYHQRSVLIKLVSWSYRLVELEEFELRYHFSD